MKYIIIVVVFLLSAISSYGQNQNISGGVVFDGEPYLSINPHNSLHIVVAWMGYVPFNHIAIKTKVSYNGGLSWSSVNAILHTKPLYGSADPSLEFDNSGNVFLSYIDYNAAIDSGSVYVRKSIDGGLSWTSPVEVINGHSDAGKYPIDRPWISIDRSGGANDGNIYITTMPPKVFGPLLPPYNPYFMVSEDEGISFSTWKYLDTINWLAGNTIGQPMPTNCVSSDGVFYAVYPSYLISQSIYAHFIIASTDNGGNSFTYNSVFSSTTSVSDSLAKKGYLLRSNPADADHLAFFYLDVTHGDIDVFMRESIDRGVNWSNAARINDDPIGNNRMQDLLWADFDLDGDIVVSWRDRRNGSGNDYTTNSEIWGAVRWKDSTSFSSNFRISDTIVAYDTILAFAGNDFMCIKLVNDTLSAIWGDTRNGKLNIWFQRMTTDGSVLSIRKLSSETIPVVYFFPNPFISHLTIEGINIQQVTIYNQGGKIVSAQINSLENNRWKIDLSALVDGIYFLQITTKQGVVTKTIVKE